MYKRKNEGVLEFMCRVEDWYNGPFDGIEEPPGDDSYHRLRNGDNDTLYLDTVDIIGHTTGAVRVQSRVHQLEKHECIVLHEYFTTLRSPDGDMEKVYHEVNDLVLKHRQLMYEEIKFRGYE